MIRYLLIHELSLCLLFTREGFTLEHNTEHGDQVQSTAPAETEEFAKSLPQLFREAGHLMRRYVRFVRQERFDPDHGQGRIIELLKKTGPLTQKDIAYFLGIRQQSLGELVRKLEDGGYITREPMPEDKRSNIVSLTDKGKTLEMPRTAINEAFSCLSDEEREAMQSYLDRICEHLQELIPDNAPEERDRPEGPCGPPMPPRHHHHPHHHCCPPHHRHHRFAQPPHGEVL